MATEDQIADEVILLRARCLGLGIPSGSAAEQDLEIAGRVGRLLDFTQTYPALDDLAERRLLALAKLAVRTGGPDPGCSVRVAAVQLVAEPEAPPVEHRYAIHRVTEDGTQVRVGMAWLSTEADTRGLYEAMAPGLVGCVRGDNLFAALARLAARLDTADLVHRDAARGEVQ